MEDEERGVKPRRRVLARVLLLAIVIPLVASVLVPWNHDMAGIQGFLLGLLVAWGVWRLAEDQFKNERFRRAGGEVVDDTDL
jgi:hypothetical protein